MHTRLGTPQDFPSVMDRVALSFRAGNPGHLLFQDLYPDSVRPDTMPQWRLALDNGEIVGGIQLVPRDLHLAGVADLPCMGLGNVFCYPTHRGKGVMSTLLNRCIADMRDLGTALCLLGGDRTRYGHFGWEMCGTQLRLSLSRGVKRHCAADPVSILDLRTWTGDQTDTSRMATAYHALPYHCARPAESFARTLERPGQVVWICDAPDAGFAYASVRGRELLEYAGDTPALDRILRFLLSTGDVQVSAPPRERSGELQELLLDNSRSFTISPTGMGRIICLDALLRAYLPLLSARLTGWTGTLALACDDGKAATLRSTTAGLVVDPGTGEEPDVTLSPNDMALLLFGPIPPALEDLAANPVLRQAFPLPLFWQPLAHV